jgi:hypothetical protein
LSTSVKGKKYYYSIILVAKKKEKLNTVSCQYNIHCQYSTTI